MVEKIYCWMSEDLKKSLDEKLDAGKLKEYFVKQFGAEDTETMYKLGFYTFAGKEGLLFAIPDSTGQQEALQNYDSVEKLQQAFSDYVQRTAHKCLGKDGSIVPSCSDFIIYDGGLESMVEEIKDAVQEGRQASQDLLERKVRPYLGLAGLISGIESGRGVSKDDFDAVMP